LINRTPVSQEMKAKYALEGASQIVADLDVIEKLGVCPVLGDYLDEGLVARHATDRVGSDLLGPCLAGTIGTRVEPGPQPPARENP